jgi:hypothetical protein
MIEGTDDPHHPPLRLRSGQALFAKCAKRMGLPRGRSLACLTLDRRTLETYATAVVTLRTANDSITRVTPLMIMLTPTRMPIAQAELNGHCT